jgi:hypothetical protein
MKNIKKGNKMSDQSKRIAMWSGPRCLSTVLMRAWENRHDTTVWDEPLFPPFLLFTKDNSLYSEEVLAKYETNWVKVMNQMTTEPIPDGKAIYYQKHISSFLLPDQMGMDWLAKLINCILIREPREMLISLFQKRPDMTLKHTGIMTLKLIFQHVYTTTGSIPPVIDAGDLQQNPRRTLSLLCEAIGVEFTEAMLSWPTGSRTTDGIWAKDWYEPVKKSTGFRPHTPKTNSVPEHLLGVLEQCNEVYWQLYKYRLH